MTKKKAAATAAPTKHSIQYLDIDSIMPSELNPRKVHDSAAEMELSESIKEIGIIQPITVRPEKTGIFEIVCGERRYRAAKVAGLNEIPAVVREFTDQEALEVMITENLQRKDVHPLEEMLAIKTMIERMGMSVLDVAAKMGKNEAFIQRRLSLENLIDNLKQKFFDNELPIGHAEFLSRYPEEEQQSWYHVSFEDRWGNGASTFKSLKAFFEDRVNKKLSEATFNTTFKNVGAIRKIACTECPNNSSVNSLFGDKPEDAVCTYQACFRDKTALAFKENLENALADKDVFLVDTGYQTKAAETVKKEGHTILEHWTDYERVSEPEYIETDPEDYLNESGEFDDEQKRMFDEDVAENKKEYEAELAEFKENSSSYKKAFDLYTGKESLIKLRSKNSGMVGSSPEDTEENKRVLEKFRLKEKIKRGRELDQEKIMKRLVDHMKEIPFAEQLEERPAISQMEYDCLMALAFDNSGYYGLIRDKVNELTGLNNINTYSQGPKVFEALRTAPAKAHALILRAAILNKYSGISPTSMNGGVIFHVAQDWCPGELQAITDEQNAVRDRREAKLNRQIEDLQHKEVEA